MPSDCPPQLQLSIQPTTTSFKRSFEEFGFDLDSPVGSRAVSSGEGGGGNERHKRARSRTSLDSEGGSSSVSDGGEVGTIQAVATVEPPRLPTPELSDVDMPSEELFSPHAAVLTPPPTHAVETTPTNTFQLTLDRFNAFDREIEVLRHPEPNLAVAISPSSPVVAAASPPVLPPLIIDPHHLSTETIGFLHERAHLEEPETRGSDISSDRSRESTSSPVRFRENLDVALERLRSPSPLVPGFVLQDGATEEDAPRIVPAHVIEHGPPTLPPIPPIVDDLHDSGSEAPDDNEEPSHSRVVPSNPPTLPPISSVAEDFPDAANAWDGTIPAQSNTVHAHVHREEDRPPRQFPHADINFERDFGQWFSRDDSLPTPSASTSAASDRQSGSRHRVTAPREPDTSPRRFSAQNIDFERDFGQWFQPDTDGPTPSTSQTPTTRGGRPLTHAGATLEDNPSLSLFHQTDINFERDFGQWFQPDDSLSTSSVSTSAATAGTERETTGHASTSTASVMPTSPPSRPPILSLRIPDAGEPREGRPSGTGLPSTEDSAGMDNPGLVSRHTYMDAAHSSSIFDHWDNRRNQFERWLLSRGHSIDIEDAEQRLRRRPRLLGDTGARSSFSSRPRSEPDITTEDDVEVPSSNGDQQSRHTDHQVMESSLPGGGRRARDRSLINGTPLDVWLEQRRRQRENAMAISDDEADVGGPSFNSLSGNSSRDILMRYPLPPPIPSRSNSAFARRLGRELAESASSHIGSGLRSSAEDRGTAPWSRYTADLSPQDRFQNMRSRNAPAALPRPSASNSLVAESASEARRQADFEAVRHRLRLSSVWESLGDQTGTHNAMDVTEDSIPRSLSPLRASSVSQRPSPPPLTRSRDDPNAHLAHLEIGSRFHASYGPSHERLDPLPPSSVARRRALNDHLDPHSRSNTSGSNPSTRVLLNRRTSTHSRVPPWELPDVSLPVGDLFETLGEGRSRLNSPQRSSASANRSYDPAPLLPHPDLGSTFTGDRYSSSDPAPNSALDTRTTPFTRASHAADHRSSRDTPEMAMAESHRYGSHRMLMRALERRSHILEEHWHSGSPELGHLDGETSSASRRNQNNVNIASTSAARSGVPPLPSTSSSSAGVRSALTRESALDASATSRNEPPRPVYSAFQPGPFLNTLRHAERHGARPELSRSSGSAAPPFIPEMTFGRDQSLADESPFTSRPLPSASAYTRTRETPSIFDPPQSFTDIRAALRQEAADRATANTRHVLDAQQRRHVLDDQQRRVSDMMYRQRAREVMEARRRELSLSRYDESPLNDSDALEPSEMRRTMVEAARASDPPGSRSRGIGRRPRAFRMGASAAHRTNIFGSDFMRDEDIDLSYEGLLRLTELAGDARPRSTPTDVIEKMEKSTYKDWKTAESDTRCPICLDDYEPDDPVRKLTHCSHWLHQECLDQWLTTANTCPVCRGSVSGPQPSSISGRPPRPRLGLFPGRRREVRSPTEQPPPSDTPGVFRFSRFPARPFEPSTRMDNLRSRLGHPEEATSPGATEGAHAESSSTAASPARAAPGTSEEPRLTPTESEDDELTGFPFFHDFYPRR